MTAAEQQDEIVAVVGRLGEFSPDGWVPMPDVRDAASGPRLSPATWRREIRALVAQGRVERRDDGTELWHRRQVWLRIPRVTP